MYWTTKLVYLVNFCMATSWKPGTVLSLVSLRLLAILFSSSVYSLHHNTGVLAELSMSFNKHASVTRVKQTVIYIMYCNIKLVSWKHLLTLYYRTSQTTLVQLAGKFRFISKFSLFLVLNSTLLRFHYFNQKYSFCDKTIMKISYLVPAAGNWKLPSWTNFILAEYISCAGFGVVVYVGRPSAVHKIFIWRLLGYFTYDLY